MFGLKSLILHFARLILFGLKSQILHFAKPVNSFIIVERKGNAL